MTFVRHLSLLLNVRVRRFDTRGFNQSTPLFGGLGLAGPVCLSDSCLGQLDCAEYESGLD